tara:strand:- start:4790 stop:6034 length:1245 start_codon:yes stop_codon:yes gene_type:complete
MKFKSDFINEISSRNFIYQASDINSLDELMSKKSITAYIGFDITSDSLHIGSLVQLMLLHWLNHYNHKTIALMGGGTTLIGDPSGKDKTRKILNKNDIDKNINKIKKTFDRFIDLESKGMIINNYDWLSELNYIDFLRDFGSTITVNKMLTYDSIKQRLEREQPLSFLEFNYILLQSYDYYHLNLNHECELQLGGSDQWGNIINGIDLIRRVSNKKVYAITSNLITNTDGTKMGKTADGAIWLNEDKLSNYDFYQFWRNIDDSNIEKFLLLFTKLPLNEISKLSKLKGQEINEAKKILAFEITKICRGVDNAKEASEISNNVFNKNKIDNRINSISKSLNDIENNSINILDAIELLNLSKSRSDTKRLIKSGGIKINDEIYKNHDFSLKSFVKNNSELKISVGKKKIGVIKIKN